MTDFSSVAMMRQNTLRRVLREILLRGPISRAELARITGVSKPTMSEVFRELEEDGWVQVSGRRQGKVGRSAMVYSVAPQRALVFGADVGGTKIRAALVDMTGEIVAETVVATEPSGGDFVVAQIADLADDLAREADVGRSRILAGTIGLPGAFDAATGRLMMVPNIEGLEGSAIRDRLEARLGFSVSIGNDVNMAAKGEQWRGAGAGLSSFAFIALGTGIGMGVINENRILSGARGAAGEIATLPVGADPYDSRTFRSGALETAVGSAAIKDRYEALGGERDLDVRRIIDRLSEDDHRAARVLDEVARCVGAAILAVCAVVDPARVILGGSIGSRQEVLSRVRMAVAGCMPAPPSITISQLGSRAGLLGTLAEGSENLWNELFEADGDSGLVRQRAGGEAGEVA
ncbi:putative NBD/HSP70 family sugar kinase [Palleronia aestuarii]|uniref:Putative NBD/HSP70 family sugar kinase n=1 Tax=Palleronia aestuarii TaxID=568105 RepID=A0A2W7MZ92_9RHOB|nr:ROK family transcriptional regulator [Palleronia aestuarii]PZX13001.1 putative NBD/HSP70 family sugar kinase [Palleronia aestuarii]